MQKLNRGIIPVILFLSALLILSHLIYEGAFTGRASYIGNYTVREIGIRFNESSSLAVDVEGNITSLLVRGTVYGDGEARIYLGDKLVYEHRKPEGIAGISGMSILMDITQNATGEEPEESYPEGNMTSEEENAEEYLGEEKAKVYDSGESEEYVDEIYEDIAEDSANFSEEEHLEQNESAKSPESGETIYNVTEESAAEEETMLPIAAEENSFNYKCAETCYLGNYPSRLELKIVLKNASIELDEIIYRLTEEDESVVSDGIEEDKANQDIVLVTSMVEIDKPVRWTYKINSSKVSELEIPMQAYNISGDADSVFAGTESFGLERANSILLYNKLGRELEKEKEKEKKISLVKDVSMLVDTILEQDRVEIDESMIVKVGKSKEIAEITFYTDGPSITEKVHDRYRKEIKVSSDIHYTSVMTGTDIPESKKESIKVYWIKDTGRELFEDVEYIDTDTDGLVDRLQWVIPHLSDQTFEVTITVLNPVTYLRDGETWVVAFNTTGIGNLTISSPNAGWAEFLADDLDTFDEMDFFDLRCGNDSLLDRLVLVSSGNEDYDYSSLVEEDSFEAEKLIIKDYSCNSTGYLSDYMLRAGYATLMFEFSGQNMTVTDYAYDPVSSIIRPDGDITTEWSTATPHYSRIYEAVTSPTAGNGDTIKADMDNDLMVEIFDMGTIADALYVSSVTVYMYAITESTARRPTVDIYLGSWKGAKNTAWGSISYAWTSLTWNGLSATKANLDGMQIKFTAPDNIGSSSEFYLDTLYAVITYTSIYEPNITRISLSPGTIFDYSNIQCNATAVDPNNATNLTIEYLWYKNSAFFSGGNKTGVLNNTNLVVSTLSGSNTNAGEIWNCTVRAHDGQYYSSYRSSKYTVLSSAPSISSPLIEPATAFSSDNLYCNATITDPDNSSNLTVEYIWYNNSVFASGGNKTGVLNSTNTLIAVLGFGNTTAQETWNCSVRAYDSLTYSGWKTASIYINRDASPPTITDFSMGSPPYLEYENIYCNATPFDEDNATNLSIEFIWYNKGVFNFSGNRTGLLNNTNYVISMLTAGNTSDYDTWNCSIRAFDGMNHSGWYSESVYIQDSIPSVSEPSISPDTVFYYNNISCNTTITDPDNMTGLTLEYIWYKDDEFFIGSNLTGLANGTNQYFPRITSDNTTTGQIWNCTVRGYDGLDYSEWSTASEEIMEGTPTISGSLYPNYPLPNEDISCNVTVIDPDNASNLVVDYVWYNNSRLTYSGQYTGVLNNTLTTISTLGSGNTTTGDFWNCSFRAYDGNSYSDWASDKVEIQSGAPSIESVSFSPSTADNDTDVTCIVTPVDPNNLTNILVEYKWYKDEVLFSEGNVAGLSSEIPYELPVLTKGNTSPNERWECHARAYDGNEYSEWSSAEIFIYPVSTHFITLLADSEIEIYGTVTGSVENTETDDGIVKEILEVDDFGNKNRQDYLRIYELFMNTLPKNRITHFNYSINAWRNGEYFDISGIYYDNSLSFNPSPIITASADGTTYTTTVCIKGCNTTMDPSRLVNSTGGIKIRIDDPYNDDVFHILSIDYQSVRLGYTTEPEVTALSLYPSPANDTEDIQCNATLLDIDDSMGLTIEYRWYNNSVYAFGGNKTAVFNNTVTLVNTLNSTQTTPGDYWECWVRGFDGDYYSAWNVSSSVYISLINSAPTISSVLVYPESPTSSSNLQCNATVADAENATVIVEYFWYNDSVLWLSGNATDIPVGGSALVSELGYLNTTKGDSWNCTVRAYDGEDYSDYDSDSVDILNNPPEITWVQSSVSANPTESSETIVWIAFNVTDTDRFSDVNLSSARIEVSLSGEAQRNSTACIAEINDTNTRMINCSIPMQYYDREGAWTINVSAMDNSSEFAYNDSFTFSYGTLQALRPNHNGVMFGSLALGQTANATNDALIINNTGNQNFTSLNLTAFDLAGQVRGYQYIPASSIYVNATADSKGMQLGNNTEKLIIGAALARDINGIDDNLELYFWIVMPSTGLSVQNYSSSSGWVIEGNS